MERFILYNFIGLKYVCTVIPLINDNLDMFYQDLEQLLKQRKIVGKVLIDLLLSRGCKKQRFISLYFNGEIFEIKSFKKELNVSVSLRNKCNSFFIQNSELLDNSILTLSQKFLFEKGRIV